MLTGKVEDSDDIGEASCHGFADEQRKSGLDDGPRLFKVGAAIHAFEHDAIHLSAEFFDAVDDCDAEIVTKLCGIAFDTAV